MGFGFNKGAMKKAKKLQKQMMEAQAAIEREEVEATAGGGLVAARVNGKHRLVSLTLKPEALEMGDAELLEDAIVTAVNKGMDEISARSEKLMGKLTGGLGIPGL